MHIACWVDNPWKHHIVSLNHISILYTIRTVTTSGLTPAMLEENLRIYSILKIWTSVCEMNTTWANNSSITVTICTIYARRTDITLLASCYRPHDVSLWRHSKKTEVVIDQAIMWFRSSRIPWQCHKKRIQIGPKTPKFWTKHRLGGVKYPPPRWQRKG